MVCPLCGARRARRSCPAIGKLICAVCCGTKRRVELACPEGCSYLAEARVHPPAAERRRRQRDFEFAVPMVHKLAEPAYRLVLMFQETVRRYSPTAIPPLIDADVAEACGTLAATLETAGKGIIYEHQAQSLPAQRLVVELGAALSAVAHNMSSSLERDAAAALRRMEEAARTAGKRLDPSPRAYLDFLGRLPAPTADSVERTPAGGSPEGDEPGNDRPAGSRGAGLIIPG